MKITLDQPEHILALGNECVDILYLQQPLGKTYAELLNHVMRVLKAGGKLIIRYQDATVDTITLEHRGFTHITRRPPHLICYKPIYDRPSWEYNLEMANIHIPDNWRVIDVGCGKTPFPRANTIVDNDPKLLDTSIANDPRFRFADIHDLSMFPSKSFDLVYSAHVFEHLRNPLRAAMEVSRIGKMGIVECPHVFNEVLFSFHEPAHLWWAWPGANALVLQRVDRERLDALRDNDFSGVMHRLLRLDLPSMPYDMLVAHRWFHRCKTWLNTIYRWEGDLKVKLLDHQLEPYAHQ